MEKTDVKTDVVVDLIGKDGNAFFIMGAVSKALRRAGHYDLVKEYTDKAMSGDYNNLLRITMEYVTIKGFWQLL